MQAKPAETAAALELDESCEDADGEENDERREDPGVGRGGKAKAFAAAAQRAAVRGRHNVLVGVVGCRCRLTKKQRTSQIVGERGEEL